MHKLFYGVAAISFVVTLLGGYNDLTHLDRLHQVHTGLALLPIFTFFLFLWSAYYAPKLERKEITLRQILEQLPLWFSASSSEEKPVVNAPVFNNTNNNVGSAVGSQVQQSGTGANTMYGSVTARMRDFQDVSKTIRENLGNLGLSVKQIATVKASLAAVDAQAATDDPDAGMLSAAASKLKDVLSSAAGSAGSTLIALLIEKLTALST